MGRNLRGKNQLQRTPNWRLLGGNNLLEPAGEFVTSSCVTSCNIRCPSPMTTETKAPEHFTANEVAKTIGVSRQTLWRWRRAGSVPLGRRSTGHSVVFTPREVELIQQEAARLRLGGAPSAQEVYLDNNSSTRPLPEVREAMLSAIGESFGNPSSAHGRGNIARGLAEDARESVAALCGTHSSGVVFVGSGTEANNLVLQQAVLRRAAPFRRIITTTIEHSSIHAACNWLEGRGIEVIQLPVDSLGRLSPAALQDQRLDSTTLVSIQWVGNETGVIQPVEELAAYAKQRGALFHTDAAQAIGKIPVAFDDSPFDYLTCTAHKIHGPQGVGAVLCRTSSPLAAMIHGGSQEDGHRAGTENLAGIAGFGAAAASRHVGFRAAVKHCRTARGFIEQTLLDRVEGACVNGDVAHRAPNASNIRFPGIDGQALVAQLDARGVFVSQSSACTNMRPEPSYVLTAMGLTEEEAYESVRISVAVDTSAEQILRAVKAILESVELLGGKVKEEELVITPEEVL